MFLPDFGFKVLLPCASALYIHLKEHLGGHDLRDCSVCAKKQPRDRIKQHLTEAHGWRPSPFCDEAMQKARISDHIRENHEQCSKYKSRDNSRFLGELTDDGKVFGFLKEYFLRWLESLSLTGELSSRLLSIRFCMPLRYVVNIYKFLTSVIQYHLRHLIPLRRANLESPARR